MSSTTETSQETDIQEALFPFEEPADPFMNKAHIINPPRNRHIWQVGMTAKDVVELARITGTEIEALCGYRFIPKYDPDKLNICRRCIDLANRMMEETGE